MQTSLPTAQPAFTNYERAPLANENFTFAVSSSAANS